jgi:hypothetical protein
MLRAGANATEDERYSQDHESGAHPRKQVARRGSLITRILNSSGTQMATGKTWTAQSVHGFRRHRNIAPYRDGEWAERGEITLETAAKIIGVCNMTALRMLRDRGPARIATRMSMPMVAAAADPLRLPAATP